MKKVPYEKLAYWKGKTLTVEQKAKRVELIKQRRDAYNKYKAEGGQLKWNDFQKTYFKYIRKCR